MDVGRDGVDLAGQYSGLLRISGHAILSDFSCSGLRFFLLRSPIFPAPVSDVPTLVTISADFMNLGHKDLLTIDSTANLHLLANKGDGSFAAPVTSLGRPTGSFYTTYLSAFAYDYDNDYDKDGYPAPLVASYGKDQGRLSSDEPLRSMKLVLRRGAAEQAAFKDYLAQVQGLRFA